MNEREAVYKALLASQENYLTQSLNQWRREYKPTSSNFQLAQQIAYGTMQRQLSLDYIAAKLSDKGTVKLKLKEKILLRMSLYQIYFLSKIPPYAVVNEMVELAKKYSHTHFVKFLNAILRKAANTKIDLPTDDSLYSLSVRFSFPEYFVKKLIDQYGLKLTKEILELENRPSVVMARVYQTEPLDGLETVIGKPCKVVKIADSAIEKIALSSKLYIQNVTPAYLIESLCQQSNVPENILDLCASPGGKLIAVHHYFPHAKLYANDVSGKKTERILENCQKYGFEAIISILPGEKLVTKELFDIVIVDAPCSNTGVLNKRPEARWRVSEETISALEQLQYELVKNAITLLKPKGEIWYMTCSILKEENENFIKKICAEYPLSVAWEQTILPSQDGWDGGYACRLYR